MDNLPNKILLPLAAGLDSVGTLMAARIPDSVDSLMSMPDIDGALVGGASLDIKKFGRIINFQSAAVHA